MATTKFDEAFDVVAGNRDELERLLGAYRTSLIIEAVRDCLSEFEAQDEAAEDNARCHQEAVRDYRIAQGWNAGLSGGHAMVAH